MFKNILIILIFLLSSCTSLWENGQRFIASEEEFVHVVFDLDWTLISQTHDLDQVALNPKKYVRFGDEVYRVADWAEDVITHLSTDPRVKLSFFSGGGIERNQEVLKKIKLVDGSGRSFFDIAHKILSRPDLTSLEDQVGEAAHFSERFKKDVRKFSSNLERVILVDDNHFFALDESYKRNFLWLGPTYKHFETPKELNKARALDPSDIYIPKDLGQWRLGRDKLLAVWGVVKEALNGNESGERSFVDLVQRKTGLLDFAGGDYNSNMKAYIEAQKRKINIYRGLQEGRIDPSSCSGLALSLII